MTNEMTAIPHWEPELIQAFDDATVDDLEFEEVGVTSHGMLDSVKTGCRPIALRGIPIPGPSPMAYVREKARGRESAYVVSWLDSKESGMPESTSVSSERDAKRLVLDGLRIFARGRGR